ncbi:histidine kinase [Asanoa sp. NPDC049518]|uniref:ATP-binding protein n=1 Tax=unclassified Asanoa TaxID=2685164 RepID=UPI00343B42E9
MNESLSRGSLADLRRVLIGKDFPPPADRRPLRPRLERWWQRWRSLAVPLALLAVLGLGAAAARYLMDARHIDNQFALMLGYATTVPILLAYHRPLWAWRLSFVMLFFGTMSAPASEAWPWNPVQIVFFLITLLSLALRADGGVVAWAGLLTLAPVFVYVNAANAWGVSALFMIVLIFGDQIRRQRRRSRVLTVQLAEQEEQSELEKARRAVLEERTRIAREMHDVVAHHMSMIAVQAETAPFRLPELDDPVRREFASIAGSARAAMVDMRRLLGVLRSEQSPALTAPQPGLGDVAELVEAARRAGVPATLHGVMPEGVDGPVALAAYRIVQEALANAARHAAGAAVRVAVTNDGDAVAVRVENDAPPTQPTDSDVPRQPQRGDAGDGDAVGQGRTDVDGGGRAGLGRRGRADADGGGVPLRGGPGDGGGGDAVGRGPGDVGIAGRGARGEVVRQGRRDAGGGDVAGRGRRSSGAREDVGRERPGDAGVPAGAGEGHGIAGMRERVTLLGGTFEAGPTVFGGFAVAARLPTALREATPEGQVV